MTMTAEFDRAEEKTLLGGLFDTVQFDDESEGVPALQPEDDDEPDSGPSAEVAVDSRGGQADEPTVAAAEVHTGAMVALIPSEEDAARLAVEGGEDPEQLHGTLAYLGEAVDWDTDRQARVVEAMERVAAEHDVLDVDGFAVSVFNPPGMPAREDGKQRDSCMVLGLSGDALEDVHEAVLDALADDELPDQHAPWHAHVTLAYSDDLSLVEQLADRVGPVTFDRLRVAFAGENIDIPLGGREEERHPGLVAYDAWLDTFDCGCR